jgi:hypothetical protein
LWFTDFTIAISSGEVRINTQGIGKMKMHTVNPRYLSHLQEEDDKVDDGEGPIKLNILIQNIKKNFHHLQITDKITLRIVAIL